MKPAVLINSKIDNYPYRFKMNFSIDVFIPREVSRFIQGIEMKEEMKDFYNRLFLVHPNLTKNEKIICGLIKLGYNTPQISCNLGKTISTIEVARTRLRKKVSITNKKISLTEYIDLI